MSIYPDLIRNHAPVSAGITGYGLCSAVLSESTFFKLQRTRLKHGIGLPNIFQLLNFSFEFLSFRFQLLNFSFELLNFVFQLLSFDLELLILSL